MAYETVEGIVIRSIDYGETHKILTLLTPIYGKVSCMARGVKKPQSRLAAVSHLFTRANFLMARGRQGMGRIEQGEVLQSYRGIRENLFMTAYATYAVELIDRSIAEQEPSVAIYQFLRATLDQLSNGQDGDIVCRIVESKALQLLGVAPILKYCSHCQQSYNVYQHINFSLGGVVCPVCASFNPNSRLVHKETWKLLVVFEGIALDRLRNVSIRPEIKRELREILWYFLDHYSGVSLKSRNFLEQMERFI